MSERNIKIETKNIKKCFSTEEVDTYALTDVDLKIYQGDYVSISGPSGCGKSTLLSILGLLDKASEGMYFIEGEDVSQFDLAQSAEIRADKIGFIFQQFNLIDELSVFENVALPLRYSSQEHSETFIKKRVEECLEIVEIAHRGSHKPNQLSGGQQQRVAIARGIVANPAILLVDEPTGNLDSKNGDIIMAMLQKLNDDGTTICMVTHDPRYADMATTQLHLLDGKIVDVTEGDIIENSNDVVERETV